jgi:exopolysaccharide biosynthesis polyprenyl glycosylphosphotransferase
MRQAEVATRARARPSSGGLGHITNIRTTSIPTPRLRRVADRPPVEVLAPGDVASPARGRRGHEHLLTILVIGDAVILLLAYLGVLYLVSEMRPESLSQGALEALAVTTTGLLLMRSQDLWVDRIIAVRAIELSRLARAVVLLGLATIVLDRALKLYFHVEEIFIGCAAVLAALVAWRSVYRTWLAGQRKTGNFQRRMMIVGTDRRAVDLITLFDTHPEVGVKVVGIVGSVREARAAGLSHLWLANYAEAGDVLAEADVESVVLCSSDINPALLDVLIREERARRRDLYLDPGLSGIDFRRVQALPIAHQPLLYVEAPSLSRLQVGVKRAFDITVAACMLILLAPVLLVIAALIKLEDRGPVLFSQKRVGRGGCEFAMVKFRSMCVDAEAKLAALQDANERNGPLFKLDGGDPRVTRVGKFLRASSLDELPQLFNVLRGDMSLVGPRPALASEVAEFPVELRDGRHQVRPGITGLWQVEARDNPSFEAYRRLDLFYVENWSLPLDLIILLGTVDQVVLRPIFSRRRLAPAPASDALKVA